MNADKKAVIDSIQQCIARLRELPGEPAYRAERETIVGTGTNIVKTAVADGILSEEEETVYWDMLVLAFDPTASKGF